MTYYELLLKVSFDEFVFFNVAKDYAMLYFS